MKAAYDSDSDSEDDQLRHAAFKAEVELAKLAKRRDRHFKGASKDGHVWFEMESRDILAVYLDQMQDLMIERSERGSIITPVIITSDRCVYHAQTPEQSHSSTDAARAESTQPASESQRVL
jgi:hypothetical protein